jgi:hypothetical protein
MERKSALLFVLIFVLLALAAGGSYYRFFVFHHYLVQYQTSCNPDVEHCYLTACSESDGADCEPSYYKIVKKYASDLYRECGPDIQDCAAAEICLATDHSCVIQECDPSQLSEDEQCADVNIAK